MNLIDNVALTIQFLILDYKLNLISLIVSIYCLFFSFLQL